MCVVADVWAGLPVTVQVRPGQAAVLHCPLLAASDGAATTFSSFTISWYRQVWEGRSPELLLALRIGPGGSQMQLGPGLRSKQVTATADGSLQLSSPQRSDTAVYYCSLGLGVEEGGWSSTGR